MRRAAANGDPERGRRGRGGSRTTAQRAARAAGHPRRARGTRYQGRAAPGRGNRARAARDRQRGPQSSGVGPGTIGEGAGSRTAEGSAGAEGSGAREPARSDRRRDCAGVARCLAQAAGSCRADPRRQDQGKAELLAAGDWRRTGRAAGVCPNARRAARSQHRRRPSQAR